MRGKGYVMLVEDWLRGCVHHDGRHGEVTLPCDEVLEIADYIESTRSKVEVVRCKDCKFYVPEDDGRCDVIEQFDLPEMFFCGNGERGEADDECSAEANR